MQGIATHKEAPETERCGFSETTFRKKFVAQTIFETAVRRANSRDTVNGDRIEPPEDAKAFWSLDQQNDDLAANKPSSSVTINNDFSGLATLLQPFLASTSREARPSTPGPRPMQLFPLASPAKPAQMTITEFCAAFKLSDALLQRLLPLEFDGPHVLAFVENEILDQHLLLTQRASLRFAESEWKKGKTGL
ncbi:hypothetical protein B0H14DRAFT_3788555 [Mycena olivaceomarginata]|nr:hypothetical protein B0H14DRAFT_3788555 [Mycena olivaceomarginata]